MTRIVELFRLDFNDVVKPQSVGEVHLINVKQGVVSDNNCRSDPCMNGGSCHVTWNDYRYLFFVIFIGKSSWIDILCNCFEK